MADAKITALDELTAVIGTDLLVVVDDPGGAPITKKATVANVLQAVGAVDVQSTDGATSIINTATLKAEEVVDEGDSIARIVDHDVYPQRDWAWMHDFRVVTGVGSFNKAVDVTQQFSHLGLQDTPGDGDAIETTIFLQAGTYTLGILGITSTNRGILDISIDGEVVDTQDWYSAGETKNVVKTETVFISSSGRHTLRITVNGHHASSIGYYLVLTAVWLVALVSAADGLGVGYYPGKQAAITNTAAFGSTAYYHSQIYPALTDFAHPAVEKVGSTYYLIYEINRELYIASSSDMLTWTDHGAIITAAMFSDGVTSADFKYISGTYYIIFQNYTDINTNIYKCTTDPTVSANWSEGSSNPIIPSNALGGTRVIDAQFMYFSGSFDPGNGDGSHPYWLLVGKDIGTNNVQDMHLFYSDSMESGWTIANAGAAVFSVASPDDIYPGDLLIVGTTIWWLYSFHDESEGTICGRLAYSSDLITWTPVSGDIINPLNANLWAIEFDWTVVGDEAWVYFGVNDDATDGWLTQLYMVKLQLDDAANTTEL